VLNNTIFIAILKGALFVNAVIVVFVALDPFGCFSSLNVISIVSVSVSVLSIALLFIMQWFFSWFCRLRVVWRVFPDIAGEYDAEFSSNYPMVQAMADGEPLTDELMDKNQRLSVVGTVSIHTTLTRISMVFKAKNAYSESEVVSCSLERGQGNAPHRLYYVFRQTVADPKPTDSSSFLGAACLKVPRERRPTVLEGEYWTNREWTKGLNTAGLVRLTRR